MLKNNTDLKIYAITHTQVVSHNRIGKAGFAVSFYMLSNANNTMHTTTYLYCFVGFNSDVPLTLRGVPLLLLRPSKDDLQY